MNWIFEWVIAIVGFVLIMSVIGHLVNGKKFFKYIRFFMGIILILIVLNPAGKLFSIDDIYNKILNICEGEFDMNSLKAEISTGIGTYTDNVVNAYKETISNTVKELVSLEGCKASKIVTDINEDESSEGYGVINSIKIYLEEEGEKHGIDVKKIEVGGDVAVNAVSDAGKSVYDALKKAVAEKFQVDEGIIDVYSSGEQVEN